MHEVDPCDHYLFHKEMERRGSPRPLVEALCLFWCLSLMFAALLFWVIGP